MHNTVVIAVLACAVAAHAGTYTTYIGDTNQYQVSAIARDTNGNTYIAGSRIIAPNAPSSNGEGVTDVFVAKLDPSGNLTLVATFSGKGTGFLMKLAADGSLIYSTYLGGTLGGSSLASVAADAQGNAYVTGWTAATDYPHTPGLPAGMVSTSPVEYISAAFFAKIDPTGSGIVYAGAVSGGPSCGATCQGGAVSTTGNSIAVDPAGNAYIAGNTDGGLAGTAGALLANGIGAFVAKINSAGTGLVYLTILGAGDVQPGVGTVATDSVSAIAADAAGNAYIAGSTSDPAFPATAGAFQTKLANPATPPFVGPTDAFVAKLNPTGSATVWATFLGGTAADSAQTIAVDSTGNVWVSGVTQSADFPTNVSVTPNGN